ncbi:MAG: addiction module protein [Cyanobacteria bacterium P01_G01_bin.54]
MLSLTQLIAEATALSDDQKVLLIDKIVESMASQIDHDILRQGVKTAQARIAEIEKGSVQTIPGDVALAQVRQFLEQ